MNTALISAIRAVKAGKKASMPKTFARLNNDDRPDEAFTTERAQRAGRANAASGRIMVTVPNDHFGPIPPSADPRGQGIRVGEFWKDRLDCRQWGAHFPHVAGIAGQSGVGAQSVVLSGGYEDDKDEGEWFLYTGSGGRDLSGNKRTNKVQSFDQTFTSMNQALKLSCERGLPVRVVRSHKEKRSAYAPSTDQPVRYDGIYRIVKCWRKKGAQGLLMCRYLFIRCDNEPAPWSSDESGDRPRDLVRDLPKEAVAEMALAAPSKDGKTKHEVFSMGAGAYWDWSEEKGEWGWTKDPPNSQRNASGGGAGSSKPRKKLSEHEKALREMSCGVCKGVLCEPVSAPCGHSFCKPCLDAKFGGQAFEHDAGAATGRSLRIRKVVMPCPCCKGDLADFLRTAQVNRDMEAMILKLQKEVEAERAADKAADGEVEEEEAAEEEEEGAGLSSPVGGKRKALTPSKLPAAGTSGPGGTSKSAAKKPKRETPGKTPAAAAPAAGASPSIVGRGGQSQVTEGDRRALATAQLCAEFPGFDSDLIEALIEQEDGDARAVKMALSKMSSQMQAEEKKQSKKAKQAEQEENKNEKKDASGTTPSTAAAIPPVAGAGISPGAATGGRRSCRGATATPKGVAASGMSSPSAKRGKPTPKS